MNLKLKLKIKNTEGITKELKSFDTKYQGIHAWGDCAEIYVKPFIDVNCRKAFVKVFPYKNELGNYKAFYEEGTGPRYKKFEVTNITEEIIKQIRDSIPQHDCDSIEIRITFDYCFYGRDSMYGAYDDDPRWDDIYNQY